MNLRRDFFELCSTFIEVSSGGAARPLAAVAGPDPHGSALPPEGAKDSTGASAAASFFRWRDAGPEIAAPR
jgi:hypothetical protein